ncbi:uncharacterized protein BDZ83DRAFT_609173 [Colletotrichum acutatum]|uniref:Secreted protein n=1 Tax=Glomerella acutata TaxID=27357 RepID=A0AAD8XIW4_GLOAC|nr:uncharacterized protein BDZ83DRAFT_609173 [Colletotrichum acutatum]KAK1728431.1 hypothetical protein BDZ83DRAFT_609173 [Colletotrichum acutatum]
MWLKLSSYWFALEIFGLTRGASSHGKKKKKKKGCYRSQAKPARVPPRRTKHKRMAIKLISLTARYHKQPEVP